MNKRFLRRMGLACLLALAGFFVIIAGVNSLLYRQQTAHLATIAQTYRDLAETSKTQRVLTHDGHAVITVLPAQRDTPRGQLLQRQLDRQRSIANGSTVLSFNGRQQQVYVLRQSQHFIGVWQNKANMWAVAPQATIGFAMVYWLILGYFLWTAWRRQRYWAGHVQQMTANLRRIQHGKAIEPIIFTAGSPFTDMGAEVNALAHHVDHLRQKVALRQASFDRLIDHLPQGVMLIDKARDVVLSNQTMGGLIGAPVAAGKHNYLDDIKTYALAKMIEHTFRNHKSHHKEITLLATQKAVDANVIALKADPEKEQVLVILYDVTYLRQVEQMQLDFVGNVSHELKTPVTAISGFAETLLAGAKDDPSALTKFLTIIKDESSRLTQLINDILTLSRPQSAAPQVAPVDLSAIVNGALQSLQQTIEGKHLKVVDDVDAGLTVTSDERKLSQVVRNLLNNAVFYNRTDGTVSIGATVAEELLTLTVADTGIGIAEDDQQRIFERFYRVDKARSRHNGGTGLGLAIVAETVQQLGGDVAVDSQVGVGTTFTVTIPLG